MAREADKVSKMQEPKTNNGATMAVRWAFMAPEEIASAMNRCHLDDAALTTLINEMLPEGEEIVRGTVYNWRVGASRPSADIIPYIRLALNLQWKEMFTRREVV